MTIGTIRLSILSTLILTSILILPFLAGAQERTNTDITSVETETEAAAEANYNNTRSNRSSISVSNDINVCDGVTCADGSCAATEAMCGEEAMMSDSVCSGFVCDSGECVSSEAMCGLTSEAEEMVSDSVCSGYLCDNGECMSSEAMCGFDFETLPGAAARCTGDANVRCGDGSCVARAEACPLDDTSPAQPTPACPENGGSADCDDGSATVRPDTPESNDTDSDGDGIGDETEAARNPAPTLSNQAEGEPGDFIQQDDDDWWDGSERAGDYNAARSNKPTRAVFSDIDSDGRPEVSLRAGGFIKIEDIDGDQGAQPAGNGEVVCWGRTEDEDGTVYAWGQGICVALTAVSEASATTTATNRLAALEVRGDDIRSWSEAERAAWQEYQATKTTTSPQEELVARMINETESNARIEEITSDDESIAMRYRTEMRLFGIFPIERTVTARSTTNGDVEVEYPWYRFLSRVPEAAIINSTLSDLQALLAGGRLDKTTPKLAE